MPKLFETTILNGLELPNRFMRSATWEGMADDDGNPLPGLLEMYARLARGAVGLIISSHAWVRREGMGSPRALSLADDARIKGMRELTGTVHRNGGRIAVELSQGGILANPQVTGLVPLVVSALEGYPGSGQGREMSAGDIAEVVDAFGRAAARAREAGFDAVQIHGAHGLLVSQFLSPAFNRRADEYGGSIENRARFAVEVIQAIRNAAGADFPLLVKMNCEDVLDGGLTVEDSLQAALLFEDAGADAIELSGGTVLTGDQCRKNINSEEKEAYWRESARIFKQKLSVPLILVGGIRSPQLAQRLLEEGCADYFALSRPLIREPELIRRWSEGDLRKAACLSDNLCREPLMAGKGIYCVVDERERAKG